MVSRRSLARRDPDRSAKGAETPAPEPAASTCCRWMAASRSPSASRRRQETSTTPRLPRTGAAWPSNLRSTSPRTTSPSSTWAPTTMPTGPARIVTPRPVRAMDCPVWTRDGKSLLYADWGIGRLWRVAITGRPRARDGRDRRAGRVAARRRGEARSPRVLEGARLVGHLPPGGRAPRRARHHVFIRGRRSRVLPGRSEGGLQLQPLRRDGDLDRRSRWLEPDTAHARAGALAGLAPLVAGRPAHLVRPPGRGRPLGCLDDRRRRRLSASADEGSRQRALLEMVERWRLHLLCRPEATIRRVSTSGAFRSRGEPRSASPMAEVVSPRSRSTGRLSSS